VTAERPTGPRRETIALGVLFGTIYFVQGIADPATGLVAQPVRSLLQNAGHDAAALGAFAAVTALPWALKPLLGLLTDVVPLAGRRRQSWLVVAVAGTLGAMLVLYAAPPSVFALAMAMLVATLGVALADVAVDGMLVERGQPLGITGTLQSVQWASMYAATMLASVLGGYLSATGAQRQSFAVAAVVVAAGLVLALTCAREPRRRHPRPRPRVLAVALARAARTRAVLWCGAFLVLWNFNPFCNTVLYVHLTRELGHGEELYGNTTAVLSGGAVLASVAYGLYCRRVPFGALLHVAIAAGVLSTLAYWLCDGPASLYAVSGFVGFAYMTGGLIQLDLAARVCPPRWAGTLFALLMALSNVAIAGAEALGGALYESWCASSGARTAFAWLCGVGATFTAACWLLVPALRREAAG
jgi:MFS family permease